MAYCGECKRECEVETVDDSFDHAFGTEHCSHVESKCCGAEVYYDEELKEKMLWEDDGRDWYDD